MAVISICLGLGGMLLTYIVDPVEASAWTGLDVSHVRLSIDGPALVLGALIAPGRYSRWY